MNDDDYRRVAANCAGSQLCMFGSAENHCGKRATWHVFAGGDVDFTMSCDDHVTWWKSRQFIDTHSIAGCCGLPGTRWRFSTEDQEGFCFVDGLGSTVATIEAESLQPMLQL